MNACLRETLAHFTVGISTLSTMESLYLFLTQKSKGNRPSFKICWRDTWVFMVLSLLWMFGNVVQERLFKNWSICKHMFCKLEYVKMLVWFIDAPSLWQKFECVYKNYANNLTERVQDFKKTKIKRNQLWSVDCPVPAGLLYPAGLIYIDCDDFPKSC